MPKTFAVLVTGSPYSSQAHGSAIQFIEAVYRLGHSVHSIFFYSDAVYVANQLLNPANDEPHWGLKWKALAAEHNISLQACVSVANKRGILNQEDAELARKPHFNVDAPFEISGLGAWADAVKNTDRTIHFS